MKNALFYLTYNGVYNYTTGIGTQTKTILKGLKSFYPHLKQIYGDFDFNIIVPRFNSTVDGYSPKHLDFAEQTVKKLGGKCYVCKSSLDAPNTDFWSVKNWTRIAKSASKIILDESLKYENVIILAVDPPFLHVPRLVAEQPGSDPKYKSVILMYTSSYIHNKKNSSYEKLGWEYTGLASTRLHNTIKVGDTCEFMTEHFHKYYGVGKDSFVPYHSSLFLEDEDFKILPLNIILSTLKKYEIPLDKDIVFAFGRASWIKGFDILIDALQSVKLNVHLVLLTVPFEIASVNYKQQLCKLKISYTYIHKFSRELPKALCQYARCKAVICPSRGEPFSNIPLEVGLWAHKNGPVIVSSNVDGYPEQIDNEKNGFIFDLNNPDELSRTIARVFCLPKREISNIRLEAYKKVVNEREFCKNFSSLLSSFWPTP